ncbi:MAG: hypothetical protein QOF45_1812 [Gaiellaceae bacterium]|nr:hypothetical protein [Gaiellaceae bacterium]
MIVSPFSAFRNTEPRLLWDPTVHKYFGEDLRFFILKLENSSTEPLRLLEGLCERAGVKSYCVYKLYGYYDALLKVWTNTEGASDLEEKLDPGETAEIVSAIDFHVHRTFYDDWSAHAGVADDRYLTSHEKDIVLLAEGTGSAAEVRGAVDRLRGARLLHYYAPGEIFSPRDFPLIKFYSSVSFGRKGEQISDIRAAVAEQFKEVRLKSLYVGAALGDNAECLVEGLIAAHDYPHLDEWTDRFYGSLRIENRMTLLIANPESPEVDILNTRGTGLGTNGHRLRRLVGDKYAAMLRSLPPEEQTEIVDVFSEFRVEALNSRFERYFLGICEARIAREEELLGEKLSFLQQLERVAMTQLRAGVLQPAFGESWHTVLNEVAIELMAKKKRQRMIELDASTKEPLLGLGEAIGAVRELVNRKLVDDAVVVAQIGNEWESRLMKAVELRNKWAHGDIGSWLHRGGPWKGWPDVARRACAAGLVYNTLAASSMALEK